MRDRIGSPCHPTERVDLPEERSIAGLCGWRTDLESDSRGEFWIDRGWSTQKISSLSVNERALFGWGIVEEFNTGLEEILVQDQSVGEMREDLERSEQQPDKPGGTDG